MYCCLQNCSVKLLNTSGNCGGVLNWCYRLSFAVLYDKHWKKSKTLIFTQFWRKTKGSSLSKMLSFCQFWRFLWNNYGTVQCSKLQHNRSSCHQLFTTVYSCHHVIILSPQSVILSSCHHFCHHSRSSCHHFRPQPVFPNGTVEKDYKTAYFQPSSGGYYLSNMFKIRENTTKIPPPLHCCTYKSILCQCFLLLPQPETLFMYFYL